ncbi:MAG: hypothetical protein EA381_16875 [Planctomycetaceae bacterium]|nr:MAG: hypothetical protein EA381_16875 [Planctomycetaceae bacterium]
MRVIEINPPLQRSADPPELPFQIVGTVELTATERLKLELFFDEVLDEYRSLQTKSVDQYHIYPHFVDLAPPGTGAAEAARKFSCVGLVVEAYRVTGLYLVDTERLPPIGLDLLCDAYPGASTALRRDAFRAMFGLVGDGPWPVLMPGYVFHSMNRHPDDFRRTPYITSEGDEYFPASITIQPN